MGWLIKLLILWSLDVLITSSSSIPIKFPYQFFIAKHTKHFTAILCSNSDANSFVTLSPQYEVMVKVQTTENLNLTEFYLPVETRAGVLLDITCQQGANLLTNKNYIPQRYEERILNTTITWLLWSGSEEDALSLARKSNLGPDSDVTLATPKPTLYRLYKLHPYSTDVFMVPNGFWTYDDLHLEHFSYHDINFHGSHINCTAVLPRLNENKDSMPGRLLDQFYHPGVDESSRASISLIHSAAERYNISLRYTSIARTWGARFPNGSYAGMLGYLQGDDVDVAVVGSENNGERLSIASYLPPIIKWKISYSFLQPDRLGGSFALLWPVNVNVWVALALTLPIFSCLFVISSYMLTPLDFRDRYDPNSYYTHEETYTPSSALLLMVGLLAQQGIDEDSQRISLRVLSFAAIEFFFLMISYYSAGILNGLLSPAPDAIQNLEELIDSSFALGFWRSPDVKQRITGNRTELAVKLLKKSRKNREEGYNELELVEGVRRVKKGNFAFLAGEGILYAEVIKQFSNKEVCSLSVLTYRDWEYFASPMAKRFSPFTDFLRNGMTMIRERGVHDREGRIWFTRKPKCLPQTFLVAVSMKSVALAYFILITGISFSSVLLVFEILYYKKLNIRT